MISHRIHWASPRASAALPAIACSSLLLCGCAAPRQPDAAVLPMGHFGHPIGTYLHLEGSRATAGKVGPGELLVDRVDGRALEQPVVLHVDNLKFPVDRRCALSGYESARWIGIPPDVEKAEQLGPQQAMWQCQIFFVATSVQAPPELVLGSGSRP